MRTGTDATDPLNADIGVDDYLDQLAISNDVPMPANLSLVVHLPFCKTLCYHCAQNKKVSRNRELMGRYIDALIDEIAILLVTLIFVTVCYAGLRLPGLSVFMLRFIATTIVSNVVKSLVRESIAANG